MNEANTKKIMTLSGNRCNICGIKSSTRVCVCVCVCGVCVCERERSESPKEVLLEGPGARST